MRDRSVASVLLLTLIWAPSATALQLTWSLQDVVFADGATAEGLFVFDTDTSAVTSWNIALSGGGFLPFTYTTVNSSFSTLPPFDRTLRFSSNDPQQAPGEPIPLRGRFLALLPETTLTVPGLVALDLDSTVQNLTAGECFTCSPFRFITQGSLLAVPEPNTGLLFAFGLANIAFRSRRKGVPLS